MDAETVEEAEKLYQEFQGEPLKTLEEKVFVAYWMKKGSLQGLNFSECVSKINEEACWHGEKFVRNVIDELPQYAKREDDR